VTAPSTTGTNYCMAWDEATPTTKCSACYNYALGTNPVAQQLDTTAKTCSILQNTIPEC